MLLLTRNDGAIGERLAGDLADVESRFASELTSDLACVNPLVCHVERYRGKMLRPTLLLASAMSCAPDRHETDEAHRVVATVAEMVHMATLVHDDILDESQMRRRSASINHLAGNEAAVMLGDYLISHAYHLCSTLEQPAICRAIATATNTVCEGELLQLANRNNWSLDERTYFEIIRRKTASLCGTCCRLAAIINLADDQTAEAQYAYGEQLGLAFQIVDDLLDLTGDQQTVGKTLGRDLEKGKLTLPLIHELASAEAHQRRELLALLLQAQDRAGQSEQARAQQIERIRDQVCRGQAVAYARQWAAKLVDQAKASVVGHLPDSPARQLLWDIADAVLTRQF